MGVDMIKLMSTSAKPKVSRNLSHSKNYNNLYKRFLLAGIFVSNTPGVINEATATTALYLVMSTLRQYSLAEHSLRSGTWKSPIHPGRTHDLSTRTLGILG